MSLLVSELSQIVDRITVIAPTYKTLHEFFESMAFELTTTLGTEQILDLQLAAPTTGPIRSWASFTLGQRGKLKVRISMMGNALEGPRVSNQLLEISDAYFLWLPPGEKQSEKVFSWVLSPEAKTKPCIIAGLSLLDGESDLRTKALVEWARRNFKHLHFIEMSPTFLSEAMEWVLSF